MTQKIMVVDDEQDTLELVRAILEMAGFEVLTFDIAQNAFAEGNYHKSYLFYSQLLASDPTNRHYLMGRAESAFHMKRFRHVIEMLGPIMAAPQKHGFNEQESEKAQQLLSESRQKVFTDQP